LRHCATKETDLRIYQDNKISVTGSNGRNNRDMFANLHCFCENRGIYKGWTRGDKTRGRRRIFIFTHIGFRKNLHMYGIDFVP